MSLLVQVLFLLVSLFAKFIRLKIFSTTTIESSITRPIATVIAPSVIIFNVMSIIFKKIIAMSSDIGIETIAMIVDLKLRRNSMMISTAKSAPKRALLNIVLTDCSIGSPWSSVVEIVIPSFSFSNCFDLFFHSVCYIDGICLLCLHDLKSNCFFTVCS